MLLTQLAKAGARLRYHGDFDWPGLRIGNHVVGEYGAMPWRFGAVEYAAVVQAAPRPGRPLDGPEVAASWDEMLAPAMRTHQLSIAELRPEDRAADRQRARRVLITPAPRV